MCVGDTMENSRRGKEKDQRPRGVAKRYVQNMTSPVKLSLRVVREEWEISLI